MTLNYLEKMILKELYRIRWKKDELLSKYRRAGIASGLETHIKNLISNKYIVLNEDGTFTLTAKAIEAVA